MDPKNLLDIEKAAGSSRQEVFRLGFAILFVVFVMIYSATIATGVDGQVLLVAAAMIGAYMAMNIGANDVANNVGPAVGSKTLTLTGAIIIAAIFEAAGAIIAGGDVTSTIRKGIVNPDAFVNLDQFVWLMTAALLAGALWLNFATYKGMPVSTTHSIVGGVLGAGIAAGGWDVASWDKVGAIVASWVISPVIGGIIAAGFLYVIKRTITYQDDKIEAAKKMVPILIAAMAWAFSSYLVIKGTSKLIKLNFPTAIGIGLVVAITVFFISKPLVVKASQSIEGDKKSISKLFTIPLIFAAALLSFAHGANDVANAVGPLAAIHDAIMTGQLAKKAPIPLWVMVIGAIGISVGLALYGPKLIRTVGSEITELDQMRAFCISMAAAITVIVASQLGMPVSSTHTAIGAVFGVGFLREAIKANYAAIVAEIKLHHEGKDKAEVDAYLNVFERSSFATKGQMLQELKSKSQRPVSLSKTERKDLRGEYTKELVKRSLVVKIVSAWIITVPASAIMAALLYFTIRGIMMP